MSDTASKSNTQVSAFRNWLSLIGLVVSIGSFFSFVLLFFIDLLAKDPNPYLGLLTFIVAPGFLAFGVFLILAGWYLQRRRIIKNAANAEMPLITIDFSKARDRRNMVIFAICSAVFLLVSAVGSYESYHFAESVAFCGQTCHEPMKPEYTTYLNSPHAKVGCTECHVGPGAVSFVKAKLNGVNQLVGTIRNNFDRPIGTPHNLRPAQETCEQCHWSKKFVGSLDRTYAHYLSDETNTPATFRLLMNVGGGDPTHGPVGGIHWHMNIGNTVEFISTNENKQSIQWIRLTDAKGAVTEFRTAEFKEDPSKFKIHKMDCLDCHNRPAHQFRAPQDSVDLAMSMSRIDPGIPLIKSNLVAVLSHTNTTETAAMEYIAITLKKLYPNEKRIESVISEAQQISRNSIFPEMKADWRSYPDNKGHKTWPGCFRCHDGKHMTADGKQKVKASGCNDCHVIIAQGSGEELKNFSSSGFKFAHPDMSSDGTDPDCFTCHGVGQ